MFGFSSNCLDKCFKMLPYFWKYQDQNTFFVFQAILATLNFNWHFLPGSYSVINPKLLHKKTNRNISHLIVSLECRQCMIFVGCWSLWSSSISSTFFGLDSSSRHVLGFLLWSQSSSNYRFVKKSWFFFSNTLTCVLL